MKLSNRVYFALFLIFGINLSHKLQANAHQNTRPETRSQFFYTYMKAPPMNETDGVVSKSSEITCSEKGFEAPFEYSCEFQNNEETLKGGLAEFLYNSLSSTLNSNDGDGVVSRSGNIVCFEKGNKDPFEYSCRITN